MAVPKKPERSLAALVEILKTRGPGELTPAELKFVRGEIRKRQPAADPGAAYQRRKESSRANELKKTRAGQDIGPIPAVQDLERKAAAYASLLQFKKTYFSHRYWLPFSADHLQLTDRFDKAINFGGIFAVAMPRGSGKTSETIVATLWAALTGRAKFIVPIGSSRERALAMIRAVKFELLGNALLAADFPEVCWPLKKLENHASRCKGQLLDGEPTNSVWSTEKLVLPTVKGSLASGTIIYALGIKGSIRGLMEGIARPDLVIPDDVQKRGSAKSLVQCEDLLQILNGDIMGLAGPGQKFSLIMPCTVIVRGDVADTVLDRQKSPLWTGQKYKMVYEFPKNMDLWEQYSVRRNDEFRNSGTGEEATAFYAANREAMDLGAVVAWPENFKPDELSGVQHAMNLLFADRWSFFAERQNSPLSEDLGDGQLEADKVAARVSGLARYVVPLACSRVTAFVDCQAKLLYFCVVAWDDQTFSGSIIDYGTWPDQKRRYFTSADAQHTLAQAAPGAGLEGQIHHGLGALAEVLLGKSYAREDGAGFQIERLLVDAGFETDTVKQWCRTTHHAARVMPSHGHGIGAAGKPWSEYDRTRCEKLGLHWMIPKLAAEKKALRHVTIDTNFWGSFCASRLLQAVGDKGALTLFGKAGQDHKMIADHLTAEYWVETQGRGRVVHEWRMKPGHSENHWGDCLRGCAVAASMLGVSLMGAEKPAGPRKKIDVAAEQASKRAEFEKRRRY